MVNGSNRSWPWPLLGGAALALLLFGCARPLPTYRYRMTVEVETPSGLKTGSSVIEIQSADKGSGLPGPEAGGINQSVIGEAVPVEISSKVTLFALLSRPGEDQYAAYLMWRVIPGRPIGLPPIEKINDLKRRTSPIEVPFSDASPGQSARPLWPLFVTFRNPDIPSSVVEVDPLRAADTLGAGVRIRRVIVQITNDPVDHKIDRYLPWLAGTNFSYLNGNRSEVIQAKDIAAHLNVGAFKREY